MNKTKKQIERDKRHSQIITAYQVLSAEGGAKMAMWAKLEKRFGYSREHITGILRKAGVDYSKKLSV